MNTLIKQAIAAVEPRRTFLGQAGSCSGTAVALLSGRGHWPRKPPADHAVERPAHPQHRAGAELEAITATGRGRKAHAKAGALAVTFRAITSSTPALAATIGKLGGRAVAAKANTVFGRYAEEPDRCCAAAGLEGCGQRLSGRHPLFGNRDPPRQPAASSATKRCWAICAMPSAMSQCPTASLPNRRPTIMRDRFGAGCCSVPRSPGAQRRIPRGRRVCAWRGYMNATPPATR